MAPASSSAPLYQKDEKVLCFHHELLYEAKVLDSKVKDPNDKKDGFMYRVHYKGWKNTYVCLLPLRLPRDCASASSASVMLSLPSTAHLLRFPLPLCRIFGAELSRSFLRKSLCDAC
jgi:hypothetical protein